MSTDAASGGVTTRVRAGRATSAGRVVVSAAAVYVLVLGTVTILAYLAFLTEFDHAIATQNVYLLGHLQDPFNTIVTRPLLGDHVAPGLVLLAPLGALPGTAVSLLLLQTAAIAATAPLLYRLGTTLGADPRAAAIVGVLWLLSPAVVGANLFDFHLDTLVAPLLVLAALGLVTRRTALLVAAAVLACSLKEDVGLTIAALGVTALLLGRRRAGSALVVGGLAWSALALLVISPSFSTALRDHFGPRFAGDRGESVADVVGFVFRHPLDAVGDVSTLANAGLLAVLVAGTGGLCLRAPRWLAVAVPSVAANLLSAYPGQHGLDYQYWIVPMAAIAIAGAAGAAKIRALSGKARLVVGACAVATGAISVVAIAAKAAEIESDWHLRGDRSAILAAVPADAVVSVPRHLAPHVARRSRVYVLAEPFFPGEPGSTWDAAERTRARASLALVVLDSGRIGPVGPSDEEQVAEAVRAAGFRTLERRGQTELLAPG